jgi:hypothetical protein
MNNCYCYKILKAPSTNPIVATPVSSRPNFVIVYGDNFTYDSASVGTFLNTSLQGFTSATIFSNTLNRTLVGAEFTANINGTFTIDMGVQYTNADVFTIFLNWN